MSNHPRTGSNCNKLLASFANQINLRQVFCKHFISLKLRFMQQILFSFRWIVFVVYILFYFITIFNRFFIDAVLSTEFCLAFATQPLRFTCCQINMKSCRSTNMKSCKQSAVISTLPVLSVAESHSFRFCTAGMQFIRNFAIVNSHLSTFSISSYMCSPVCVFVCLCGF